MNVTTYDFRTRSAAEDDTPQEEAFNELLVADYLVFLFAFDTYVRWLKEADVAPPDPVFSKGLSLLRRMDQDRGAEVIATLEAGIKSPGSLTQLASAMKVGISGGRSACLRSLRLRSILLRGGVATAKHIFGTSIKARKEVLEALGAAMNDSAVSALAQFGTITLKNKRLENWVSSAAARTGQPFHVSPVLAAANQVGEASDELVDQKIVHEAALPTSEAHADSRREQGAILATVQGNAQEAAAKALSAAGFPDEPLKKSEVIGIATAVATAVSNDPADLKNVPPAFVNKGRPLDPEQMDAARTNGKVLVAAGAGAGKSTTLVSRVAYLIDNLKTNPARIMAVTFSRKAADELQEKISKKVGDTRGKAVFCDTMHTLFKKFIVGDERAGVPQLGTPEQKRMMERDLIATPQKGKPPPRVKPGDLSRAIQNIWGKCKPEQLAQAAGRPNAKESFADPPKAKKAGLFINKWSGNDVSYQQALANAKSDGELKAALYYQMYLGLKGDIPGWKPLCGTEDQAKFMNKFRPGGERLGDMDDMLKIFRDILRDNPKAKETIQGMFDHILIDEAQDSNLVQHQIFDLLSEKIECDDKKKSIWLVGDDRQAIYQFRGAKPELFQKHWDDGCWKPKKIRTNYRCPPEVVEMANRLVAHNPDRLPVDAVPNPAFERGKSSIFGRTMNDNTEAAVYTMDSIRKDMETDPKNRPEDYAILARTNNELNNFETACIINEIPYTRRGGHGFLDAPESKCVLGYIDLASGTNYEKKVESLAAALNKPDRGLFNGGRLEPIVKAINDTIDDLARAQRKDKKDIDPGTLITDRFSAQKFAENLKMPYKNQLTAKGTWLWDKVTRGLQSQLLDMGRDVEDIRTMITKEDTPTVGLLEHILDNVKATVTMWNPTLRREVTQTMSLREDLSHSMKLYGGSDDEDEEETDDDENKPVLDENGNVVKEEAQPNLAKGLGAVQFLYSLAEPNKNDHDQGVLPNTAAGFVKKIERFTKLADTLRIDNRKWEDAQKRITDPALRQEKPPAVTLTTVHSVKGLEWPHCTVLVPGGLFPIELKAKPDEPPPTEEEQKEHDVSELNLAYVALTRAAKTLDVISIPKVVRDKKTGRVVAVVPSKFINMMGLKEGQNVPKPEAEFPLSPSVVPAVVTANEEALFEISQWPDIANPSYDRRPS